LRQSAPARLFPEPSCPAQPTKTTVPKQKITMRVLCSICTAILDIALAVVGIVIVLEHSVEQKIIIK
jgi:hypothetical protein